MLDQFCFWNWETKASFALQGAKESQIWGLHNKKDRIEPFTKQKLVKEPTSLWSKYLLWEIPTLVWPWLLWLYFRTPTRHLCGQFQCPLFKFSWDQQGTDWSAAPHPVPRGSRQHPDGAGTEYLPKSLASWLSLFLDPKLGHSRMPEVSSLPESIYLSINSYLPERRAQCPWRSCDEI